MKKVLNEILNITDWKISFSTYLNEHINIKILARTYESALKKIIKMFPSAYNFR